MKNVLVIFEDYVDSDVIGVVDSVENAEKILKEYYGEYKEIAHWDVREGNLECTKILDVKDHLGDFYKTTIQLIWYTINSL